MGCTHEGTPNVSTLSASKRRLVALLESNAGAVTLERLLGEFRASFADDNDAAADLVMNESASHFFASFIAELELDRAVEVDSSGCFWRTRVDFSMQRANGVRPWVRC